MHLLHNYSKSLFETMYCPYFICFGKKNLIIHKKTKRTYYEIIFYTHTKL